MYRLFLEIPHNNLSRNFARRRGLANEGGLYKTTLLNIEMPHLGAPFYVPYDRYKGIHRKKKGCNGFFSMDMRFRVTGRVLKKETGVGEHFYLRAQPWFPNVDFSKMGHLPDVWC